MGLGQLSSSDDSATNRSTEISEAQYSGTTAADSSVVSLSSPAQDPESSLDDQASNKVSSSLLRPVGYPSPVTQLFDYILKAWDYQKGDHCSYKYIPSRETHLEMTATVMIRLPDRAAPMYVKDCKFRASRVLAQNAVAQLALKKLAEEDPELQQALDKAAKEMEERASMPPPPPPPSSRSSYSYNYNRATNRYSGAAVSQYAQGYYYPTAGGYYPGSDHEMNVHPMMAADAMYYQNGAASPDMMSMSYYGRAPPPPAPLIEPQVSAVSSGDTIQDQQENVNASMNNCGGGAYVNGTPPCPIMTPTGQWYGSAGNQQAAAMHGSPSSPHHFHPSFHWQYMQPPASPMGGGYYTQGYGYGHPPPMHTTSNSFGQSSKQTVTADDDEFQQ